MTHRAAGVVSECPLCPGAVEFTRDRKKPALWLILLYLLIFIFYIWQKKVLQLHYQCLVRRLYSKVEPPLHLWPSFWEFGIFTVNKAFVFKYYLAAL